MFNIDFKCLYAENYGPVAKLADAPDLGSGAAMCESSSVSGPTILKM